MGLGKPFFTKKPVRWGIIGCGNVTEIKSGPPYQQTQGFELAMVMRRNGHLAQDYAQRHGISYWTTDAAEIIENPQIDAVYIATPPDTHKQYGLQVAARGKPCCIEKPMAPNYQDSLAIFKAFDERKVPLFIAYYRRTLPRFLKIKQWLNEGWIGEVRQINWVKTRTPSPLDLSKEYNWRTDAKVAPGGYFDDLASHGLDLFTFLLGDITSASGMASNQQGLYTAVDAVSGSWVHQNGTMGSGIWNFGGHMSVDHVEILGSNGMIKFSVLHDHPIELTTKSTQKSLMIEHPKHLHHYHVAQIRANLLEGAPHPSTGNTGLHTSWVMDRILGTI